MGIAHNGRVDIAYQLHGPANGVPMLLICGLGSQMVHWPTEFLEALAAQGFSVARFDNRDSGRSTNCAELPRYTLADMADDAVAVLDDLEWHSAHVFGVSLGGMVAQVMAVHHPDRVRSLTSMSAAPAWSARLSRPRLRTLARLVGVSRTKATDRDAAAEQWVRVLRIAGSPGYPLNEQRTRRVAAEAFDIAHDPKATMRHQAACKASGDRRTELGRVRVPTLVLHGEADPMQSVRAGRATADAIPGARLVTYPGVGHYVDLDQLLPRIVEDILSVTKAADPDAQRSGRSG